MELLNRTGRKNASPAQRGKVAGYHIKCNTLKMMKTSCFCCFLSQFIQENANSEKTPDFRACLSELLPIKMTGFRHFRRFSALGGVALDWQRYIFGDWALLPACSEQRPSALDREQGMQRTDAAYIHKNAKKIDICQTQGYNTLWICKFIPSAGKPPVQAESWEQNEKGSGS